MTRELSLADRASMAEASARRQKYVDRMESQKKLQEERRQKIAKMVVETATKIRNILDVDLDFKQIYINYDSNGEAHYILCKLSGEPYWVMRIKPDYEGSQSQFISYDRHGDNPSRENLDRIYLTALKADQSTARSNYISAQHQSYRDREITLPRFLFHIGMPFGSLEEFGKELASDSYNSNTIIRDGFSVPLEFEPIKDYPGVEESVQNMLIPPPEKTDRVKNGTVKAKWWQKLTGAA